VILPAVRTGQSFIFAVCTSARGCLSVLSILIEILGNLFKIWTVRVGDPVEESVSESSGSLGCRCGDGRVSVRLGPEGSCLAVAVVCGKVLRGKSTWSVALLFASHLVSRGVGNDGVRDSLSTVCEFQDQVLVSKKK
jgi:hypothetical protein